MNIKTIDINCKEWFDKVNGNSYFAGTVTINYGMKTAKTYKLRFQYGYSDHFIEQAYLLLINKNVVADLRYDGGWRYPLLKYCRENNVILRKAIQRGCLKRDVLRAGA